MYIYACFGAYFTKVKMCQALSASCEVFVSLLCHPWVFGLVKFLIILPFFILKEYAIDIH